jgi:hypothetical protein
MKNFYKRSPVSRSLVLFLGIIVIGAVITSGVFAQEDSGGTEGAASDTGKVFFNAGIGAGISRGKAARLNGTGATISFAQFPLSVGADFKLPLNFTIPGGETFITLGGTFFYSSLNSTSKISDMGFGIRPAIHIAGLNLFEKLFKNADSSKLHAYLAIPIGWVIQTMDGATLDEGSGFHLGLDVGTKYFFIKNLGVYAEANLNLRLMIGGSIGLTARI